MSELDILHKYIRYIGKNKLHKNTLNNKDPMIDPCATPNKFSMCCNCCSIKFFGFVGQNRSIEVLTTIIQSDMHAPLQLKDHLEDNHKLLRGQLAVQLLYHLSRVSHSFLNIKIGHCCVL